MSDYNRSALKEYQENTGLTLKAAASPFAPELPKDQLETLLNQMMFFKSVLMMTHPLLLLLLLFFQLLICCFDTSFNTEKGCSMHTPTYISCV